MLVRMVVIRLPLDSRVVAEVSARLYQEALMLPALAARAEEPATEALEPIQAGPLLCLAVDLEMSADRLASYSEVLAGEVPEVPVRITRVPLLGVPEVSV